MKIQTTISPKLACQARSNVCGEVTVEIDISGFTQEQADELALANRCYDSGRGELLIHDYDRGILDAANLAAWIDGRLAVRRANQEATDKRRAEQLAQARAEIAEKRVPKFVAFCDSELSAAVRALPGYDEAVAADDARAAAEKAAAERAAAEAAAAKAAAEAAAEAERLAWIAQNGSDRLRRCVAEGIQCGAIYRSERMALERPGWRLWDDVRGDDEEARNPPAEALDLLDEARATAPDARLVYVTADATLDEDGYETSPEIRGYACQAKFLGRQIVFGDLWE